MYDDMTIQIFQLYGFTKGALVITVINSKLFEPRTISGSDSLRRGEELVFRRPE